MQSRRRLLSPAHFSLAGGPQCDAAEPLNGTKGSAWSGSLRGGERLPVLPSEPLTGEESDCGGAAAPPLQRGFNEDRKLHEREQTLALQKAQLARELQKSPSLLVADQAEEVRSPSLSTSRELAFQRAGVHSLDEYVVHKPADVVDGMNRISAYVGGRAAGGAPPQTFWNGATTTAPHASGPRMQRAEPVVKRAPPLQSPRPADGMFLSARQQEEQQQLRPFPTIPAKKCLDAGVQTGTATEDVTGGRPLTIERDETFTKRVPSSVAAASSTSSLSLTRASGASSSADVRSHDGGSHNKPCSEATSSREGKKKEKSEKSLDVRSIKTEAENLTCEAGGDKSSQDEEEKARSPTHNAGGVTAAAVPSPPPKIATAALPTLLALRAKSLSPVPDLRAAPVGSVESNEEGGGPKGGGMTVDPGLQYAPPVGRTTAWYLPNSRVLEHAEFKNLLCGDWMPPPKSVQDKPAPVARPNAVRVAVAQASSPAEVRHPSLGTENFIVEFPPPPDLQVPDMPPPGRQRKKRRLRTFYKACLAFFLVCRCFPTFKEAGQKRNKV
ncbi:uncharacterized protein Tco025E_07120 [Trypanosoma conorhini]|uniref:Uncharacterized protein n=1 Tax=Trypanosoma conorhini TaxID=83891 RepID=A0A422NTB7_9TRYP|nr:uncharacterized protein Tco025E_07120 [Trypanosoma conorhini]RNF08644.1 hypothetical protein Tco025E_07120 [Trypanosoma conorhini]